jgi:hypothetical protein
MYLHHLENAVVVTKVVTKKERISVKIRMKTGSLPMML